MSAGRRSASHGRNKVTRGIQLGWKISVNQRRYLLHRYEIGHHLGEIRIKTVAIVAGGEIGFPEYCEQRALEAIRCARRVTRIARRSRTLPIPANRKPSRSPRRSGTSVKRENPGAVARAPVIWQPALAVKPALPIFAAALALVLNAPFVSGARAADARIDVAVDCHCPDSVGAGFCEALKQRVAAAPGYHLAASTSSGYGIGVHLSSVDLWQGINAEMAGRISAVSVAFTIYADKLPGEVYADSSVFRVGKDTFPEMSSKIVGALGQIVNLNGSLFNQMRIDAEKNPASAPVLKPAPTP
jgi:hypothetical protein